MQDNQFGQIHWASFEVALRVEAPLRLPEYKGSVLRGAFGATFKRLVCVMPHRDCARCLLRQQCVYSVDFETPVGDGEYAPHPFVIEPPLERQTDYAPGDRLGLGLVLIGRALDHLPYFVYTLEEMGRAGIGRGRGQCRLETVWHLGLDQARCLAYDREAGQLLGGWRPAAGTELNTDGDISSVVLEFLTPTRMRVKDDLLIDLDFETLVRSLLRRISRLSEQHCGGRLDLDFRELVSRAKAVEAVRRDLRWHDWERYSGRQRTRMKLGGFVGEVEFAGDVSGFMSLLRLGSYLHVGKGTAFGLGKYEVRREPGG